MSAKVTLVVMGTVPPLDDAPTSIPVVIDEYWMGTDFDHRTLEDMTGEGIVVLRENISRMAGFDRYQVLDNAALLESIREEQHKFGCWAHLRWDEDMYKDLEGRVGCHWWFHVWF